MDIETPKDKPSDQQDGDSLSSVDQGHIDPDVPDNSRNGQLTRSFSPSQVHVISLGSNIGSGLFIGTGKALANGGPGTMLLAYFIVCTSVWAMLQTLSEMTIMFPVSGSFVDYTDRWVDPALAFGAGFAEWLGWTAVAASEVVFFAILAEFWNDGAIPEAALFTIFLAVVIFIFLLPNKVFAWFEYVTSLVKLFAFALVIFSSLAIVCGAGPRGHIHNGNTWTDLPAFKNGFKGFGNCVILAVYAVGDQVFYGIVGGEAESPRYSMAHAAKLVPGRVGIIYTFGVTFITLLIRSDDERLLGGSGSASSPFILATKDAGIPVIPHIINFCIIVGITAMAAESIYISSRMMRTLAHQKLIPEFIAKVDSRGRPRVALALTCTVSIILTYINLSAGGIVALNWLINIITTAEICNWLIVGFVSFRFHAALKAQGDGLWKERYAWKSFYWPLAPAWLLLTALLYLIGCLYLGVSSEEMTEIGLARMLTPVTGDVNNHGIGISTEQSVEGCEERSSNERPGEARSLTGANFWLVMLTLAAVLVLSSIDMNIVATAVPSLTDHFHTVADVGWYSSAFRLCQCAFQFVFGKAYQLFSAKKVFLFANILSVAGSLICGAATTSTMFIIGRAMAGVGSAGLLSGCFVILVQSTPLRRRPMFTGMMGAVEGLATLCTPLLGGAIVQSLGWRWCFYINAPIGAVTLLLTMSCFSDIPKPSHLASMGFKQKVWQLDLISNLLFIPALTGLFLALSWAGTKYSWNSGPVVGPLVSFAVLIAVFFYNQRRRRDAAALPLRIMKRRSVVAGFVFMFCGNSAGSVLEYYLPTYYQVVRGYTPTTSGYMMLPIIIAGTLGALIHGFGTSAFGYYAPFMLFASLIMPIAAGLITTVHIDTSFAQLIIYTGLSGFAYGIGFSGPQNAVQTVLPEEDVPLGTSVMLFAQSFGPAVAVAVAQVLFVDRLSSNLESLASGADIADLGLTEIVTSIPSAEPKEVLQAIDRSLIQTWYLVVGLACATMVGSVLIEWRSVKARRD
ncbi:hypothetical protein FE257_005390 [Aspergillus nanangensis]|uniref:Major facilitator superfamily (MFS) profile domain-containing protein n=1 Tax=Aspergillus nanangensis TaxID=2582783 RepID=A0AAD4GUN9_ASPNN|nr:hypothetical protein FE257_005390 [Aspergillus nanangensis]